jgi:hypothetical protein
MLEQVELVIDETAIEFANAVGMTKEIGSRVGEIVARAIRDVVRDLYFLHLIAIDGMRTEIARNCGHYVSLLQRYRPPGGRPIP